MSNGVSYPVFRTSDPSAALAMARRLLALGEQQYAQVSVDVELCTIAEVQRLHRALPDAWFRTENDDFWYRRIKEQPDLRCDWHASELLEGTDDLGPLLPLWASMLDQPVGSIEDRFTTLVGANHGSICWEQLLWPEAPEHGYHGRIEHDQVIVVFNGNDDGTDHQAGTHTVCVRAHRTERARRYLAWLAAQAGEKVIGPPYDG